MWKSEDVKKIRVAIDGPVSSGKSTVGSKVAARVDYLFLDTGMMYRALAYKIRRDGVPEEEWGDAAGRTTFEWRNDRSRPDLFIDGEPVSDKLSSSEVASFTSRVAARPEVRKVLVAVQREEASGGGVVMVGRDIGTVVMPDAELKIFLNASVDVRVARRFDELRAIGEGVDMDTLRKEILERDERDSTRRDSPLRLAEGGVEVNTTNLTIEAVVERIAVLIREREK